MGFLIGAIALIGFIAVLSKIKFQSNRVCPRCSEKTAVAESSCTSCGYMFPVADPDDNVDSGGGDDGGGDGGN
ncbi:hypothetical protein [Ammoniphilus sp. YIM 78166]|uniref:hypothetical protein n=1 Tax=Ammoniphilus sp. YIM 78166 TaxID=1644106 RepID=UPI00106FCCEF|nr:hypothetical protein [Ammoniphilus sp. YIM 78166]